MTVSRDRRKTKRRVGAVRNQSRTRVVLHREKPSGSHSPRAEFDKKRKGKRGQ